MKKFTVFTIILTILVVVVASEVAVNDYLPSLGEEESFELNLPESLDLSQSISTNSFGSDLGVESAETVVTDVVEEPSVLVVAEPIDISFGGFGSGSEDVVEDVVVPELTIKPSVEIPVPTEASSSGLPDFEDASYVSETVSVFLREDMLTSAGFVNAYIEEESHGGKLYKTISIGDLFDVETDKFVLRTNEALLAKVYIFKMGLKADVNQVYQLLKMRAGDAPSSVVNETNELGSGSFYMNDANRSATAFLTVRIGSYIYSFSYPKDYHSQVKNLIMLLEWELG